jgi:hypothetical protein
VGNEEVITRKKGKVEPACLGLLRSIELGSLTKGLCQSQAQDHTAAKVKALRDSGGRKGGGNCHYLREM